MPAALAACTPAGRVLHHRAAARLDAEGGGGVQEQVRFGLAHPDVLGAEQAVAEAVEQPGPVERQADALTCRPLEATQVITPSPASCSSTAATPGTASTSSARRGYTVAR